MHIAPFLLPLLLSAAPCAADKPQSQASPSGASGVTSVAEEAPEPQIIASPRYQENARRARIQGRVVVLVAIDSLGGVVEARVKSPVHPLLDNASIESARLWRFKSIQATQQRCAELSFQWQLLDKELVQYRPPFDVLIQAVAPQFVPN